MLSGSDCIAASCWPVRRSRDAGSVDVGGRDELGGAEGVWPLALLGRRHRRRQRRDIVGEDHTADAKPCALEGRHCDGLLQQGPLLLTAPVSLDKRDIDVVLAGFHFERPPNGRNVVGVCDATPYAASNGYAVFAFFAVRLRSISDASVAVGAPAPPTRLSGEFTGKSPIATPVLHAFGPLARAPFVASRRDPHVHRGAGESARRFFDSERERNVGFAASAAKKMRRPLEPRVACDVLAGSRVFNDLLQESGFVEADPPGLPAGLADRRGGGEQDQHGNEGAEPHGATSTFS